NQRLPSGPTDISFGSVLGVSTGYSLMKTLGTQRGSSCSKTRRRDLETRDLRAGVRELLEREPNFRDNGNNIVQSSYQASGLRYNKPITAPRRADQPPGPMPGR